jgi:hypothetical protein
MKIILFGARGMVECLLDPEVESVLANGRSATGQQHEKLHEIVHKDSSISRLSRGASPVTTPASSVLASPQPEWESGNISA